MVRPGQPAPMIEAAQLRNIGYRGDAYSQPRFVKRLLAVPLLLAVAACDPAPRDLERARKANTTEAYQEFLSRHPRADPALREEALRLTEALRQQAREREAAAERAAALRSARALDTVPAYRDLTRRYPGSPEAKAAESEIARLIAARLPPLAALATLSLKLDLRLEGKDGVDLAPRLREFFARTLGYVGIALADGTGEDALVVTARGAALGTSYSATGLSYDSDYRETAARLSGSFELRHAGSVQRREFAAHVEPPEAFFGSVPAVPYDQAAGLPVRNGLDLFADIRPADGTLVARWLLFLREFGGPGVARAAVSDASAEHWRTALVLADRWRADGAGEALLATLSFGPLDNLQLFQALGKLGGEAAADALIERLPRHLADHGATQALASALGRLGDPRAIPPLIDALGQVEAASVEGDRRGDAIVKALRAISGASAGASARSWREWYDRRPPGTPTPSAAAKG